MAGQPLGAASLTPISRLGKSWPGCEDGDRHISGPGLSGTAQFWQWPIRRDTIPQKDKLVYLYVLRHRHSRVWREVGYGILRPLDDPLQYYRRLLSMGPPTTVCSKAWSSGADTLEAGWLGLSSGCTFYWCVPVDSDLICTPPLQTGHNDRNCLAGLCSFKEWVPVTPLTPVPIRSRCSINSSFITL